MAPHFNLLLLYLFLNIPSYLAEYYLLLNKHNKSLVGYGVLVFVLQLGIVATLPLMGYGLSMTLQGLCLFAGLKLASLLVIQWRLPYAPAELSDEARSPAQWARLLSSLALPLMLALLLGGLSVYVDGFIVLNKLDTERFAIFQYGAKEFPLFLLMANALSTAAAAGVATDRSKALTQIKGRSLRMLHLFFPLAVLLMVGSQWFYPIVFTDTFAESALVFNVYLLLLVSRMLFPQTVLTGLQRNRIQLLSAGFELVLNVVLSLVFLQIYGLIGIALATVLAHLVDKLLLMVYLQVKEGISPTQYAALSYYLIYGLLLYGLCFFIMYGI